MCDRKAVNLRAAASGINMLRSSTNLMVTIGGSGCFRSARIAFYSFGCAVVLTLEEEKHMPFIIDSVIG